MLTFKKYIKEAWSADISQTKRDPIVSDTKPITYDDPNKFDKNANKIGEVGGLHLYHSSSPGSGASYFTYNPEDKKIHHTVRFAGQINNPDKSITYQFPTTQGRKSSPVRMNDVIKSISRTHNASIEWTKNSEGMQKSLNRMMSDPEMRVHGLHSNGFAQPLTSDMITHIPYGSKDPEQQKIGRMKIVTGYNPPQKDIGG
jgi:hypothetical protein